MLPLIAALAPLADGLIDRLFPDSAAADSRKAEAKLAIMEMAQRGELAELEALTRESEAKAKIMIAEQQHGDAYTRHTRPMLIRWGLYLIAWNYGAVPVIGAIPGLELGPVQFPSEFWMAWGGAVSVYIIGRSAEKSGAGGRIVQAITGRPASRPWMDGE